MSSKRNTKRRKTIGQSPLDGLLGPAPQKRRKSADEPSDSKKGRGGRPRRTAPPRRASKPPTQEEGRPKKVRATFHLPAALLDECRDTVVALSGPPERMTMARLAADALRREIARLRRQYNHGDRFPVRDGELRGGRPVGS